MDTALTSTEKRELCNLLDIPRKCYGNFPLMKQKYKNACLRLHPDKGGDENQMTTLNVLWGKFHTSMYGMRRDYPSFEEVSSPNFWEEDFPTLHAKIRGGYKASFFKSPSCVQKQGKKSLCPCISCSLQRQHQIIKQHKKKPCLVWGECFCVSCYLLWFGFPLTWECLEEWQKIIEHTDCRLLHLHLY